MAKRYCMPDPTQALTDEVIMAQIAPGHRVIDLGCGDGRLLRRLQDEKQCSILGIELDRERILHSVANGVPVVEADLDRGLPDVPDRSFDFAVLSQTLQQVRRPKEVLQEMLRVARRALVVVPNFGHWRVRLQVLFYGRAPVTEALPYDWYNTPNLHLMTTRDFRDLAERLNYRIIREITIIQNKAVDRAWASNLRAESAMYVLERNGD
jgi:methionine biosynthesis protein MetW